MMNFRYLTVYILVLVSISFSDNCYESIKKYQSSDPAYENNRVESFVRHYLPGNHYEDKYKVIRDTIYLDFFENGNLSKQKFQNYEKKDSIYYRIVDGVKVDSSIITNEYHKKEFNTCYFNIDNIVCIGSDTSPSDTTFVYEENYMRIRSKEYTCLTVNNVCECNSIENYFYKKFSSSMYVSYDIYQTSENPPDTTFRNDTLIYVTENISTVKSLKTSQDQNQKYNVMGVKSKSDLEYDFILLKNK